jgi:hypothetical protein
MPNLAAIYFFIPEKENKFEVIDGPASLFLISGTGSG